jgi:hypothetical protein
MNYWASKATLSLGVMSLVLATAAGAGAEELALLPKDVFRLSVRGGIQGLHYEEKLKITSTATEVKSDYDSFGPVIGVDANLRIAERFAINGSYLGSFIQKRTEEWNGTDQGLSFDQDNDLDVDFHVFDIDLGYSIIRHSRFEWRVFAGWHYYMQDFSRKNVLGPSVVVGTVTEDVRGQGIRVGSSVEYLVNDRLSLTGGLAYQYLYDVRIDNSLLGILDSEGHAVRWNIGLDYFLTKNATLGVMYQGHYITVDKASRSIPGGAVVILPDNETLAHTGMVVFAVRY